MHGPCEPRSTSGDYGGCGNEFRLRPIYERTLEGLEVLRLAHSVDEAVLRVQAFIDRIDAIAN